MLIGHLHIFFYKMPVQIFGHFSAGCFPIIINKFWELFLYSWYKSFIRYLFCKHFTQSVTCPFIWTVYFKKQKKLISSVVYQRFFLLCLMLYDRILRNFTYHKIEKIFSYVFFFCCPFQVNFCVAWGVTFLFFSFLFCIWISSCPSTTCCKDYLFFI